MAALSRTAGNTIEKRFVFSVSRTALASRWVQEQMQNPDEFLQQAGLSRFFNLLLQDDEGPDDYPEVQLNSRTAPSDFLIPSGTEFATEIDRVRREVLDVLRTAAYSGHRRISKDALAERVCTRSSVLDRALVYLEERGFTKGAFAGDIKITTAGEAELETLRTRSEVQEEPNRSRMNRSEHTYDVFVSHASEDKQTFVALLVDRLKETGLRVWYDDFVLKLGDSLRARIDEGLRDSRFGVVILSHAFFAKSWPQRELNGLFALAKEGERRILPIWHNVTAEELKRYSPMLADIKAARSSDGLEAIVRSIRDVVSPSK